MTANDTTIHQSLIEVDLSNHSNVSLKIRCFVNSNDFVLTFNTFMCEILIQHL